MGTNYYLREKCCDKCFRYDERHIGKSSAGWCFGLRVYPEDGINSLDDWKQKFSEPGALIFDEYGEQVPEIEMLACITERSHPRGLSRHCGDQYREVRAGEGTFDYCNYAFS